MPIFTLISKLNSHLATPLLRHGLSLRVVLGGGVIRPSPYLDYISLVPWGQKLVSGEVHNCAEQTRKEREKEPSALDVFVDRAWDRLGLEDASRALNAEPPVSKKSKLPRESDRRRGRRRKNRQLMKQQHQQQEDEKVDIAPKTNDNPQLEALEGYLRPALVPNERWEDIPSRWYFNTPFVKWARLELLKAKYGEDVQSTLMMPKYSTELSAMLPGLAAAANKDTVSPDQPPTLATLAKAFQMADWTREKNTDAVSDRVRAIAKQLGGRVVPIPGSAILYPEIPGEADTSSLSLEDILELGGGHVSNCGPFNYVCEQAGIYEFWTREYIDGLAAYLTDRADSARGNTVILDVGAGDGTLAHFLRSALEAPAMQGEATSTSNKNVSAVVATDDGSWKIRPRFEVENIGVAEAVAKYRQKCEQLIVLCSWMPMGVDWTAEIRANGADEIILIGECDDGNCGHNWLTWGNPDFQEDMESIGTDGNDDLLTPYRNDNYKRFDLEDLSRWQCSRFDSSVSSNSKTVSFRK